MDGEKKAWCRRRSPHRAKAFGAMQLEPGTMLHTSPRMQQKLMKHAYLRGIQREETAPTRPASTGRDATLGDVQQPRREAAPPCLDRTTDRRGKERDKTGRGARAQNHRTNNNQQSKTGELLHVVD
jgi:hypothetical protein